MKSDALVRRDARRRPLMCGERGVLSRSMTIIAGMTVAVIAVAGILKLSDIESFYQSLSGWAILPGPVVPLLAVVVPGTEIAIGILWLMPASRRFAVVVALIFLVVVSIAAVTQHALYGYVDCGCFGRRAQAASSREGFAWLLGRNTVMIMTLLAACAVRPGGTR